MQQAMAQMIQTQTTFLLRIAETDAELLKVRREIEQANRLNAQTFARIEAILGDLPEAVHRRFDFPPSQTNGRSHG
jgi:hypothetical protein